MAEIFVSLLFEGIMELLLLGLETLSGLVTFPFKLLPAGLVAALLGLVAVLLGTGVVLLGG